MGSVFKFKQFEVDQRDCAMKINTDGVLLGATVDVTTANRILDIGTGTGVIAMMLAQRSELSIIDAVEIDESAYNRALGNFQNSNFHHRLHAFSGSYEILDAQQQYDLIVSNPPFYTNSLHNPDDRKKLARHTDHDFFNNLLGFAFRNLKEQGRLSLIVPDDLANYLIQMGSQNGLNLIDEVAVKSFEGTEVIRKIITLKKAKSEVVSHSTFVIYREKGVYSDTYRQILQPFFLAF